MLRLVRASAVSALLGLGVSACFFPDYTFKSSGSGGGAQTSSTSTNTSTSLSSTGGGGGSGPKEDCFNGLDDDGDGLADCDDPDCAPVTECAPPIPVGWGTFGLVVLSEGDPTVPVTCPSYATVSKYTGNANLLGGTWTCGNCGCDAPIDQACDLKTDLGPAPGIQPFQIRDVPCTTINATNIKEVSVPDPPWDLMCFDGSPSDTIAGGQACPGGACNQSIESAIPIVSGGSCSPNGGAPNLTVATWELGATACGNIAPMAGCTSPSKCMPKPSAPFFGRVCVGKAGDQTCPTEAFTKKHLYEGTLTDTRGCDMCQCKDPTGGTCTLQIKMFSTVGCTGSAIATFNAGVCADLIGNPAVAGREATLTQAPNGGSCMPTKLVPDATGSIVESEPTTFCCLP